MEELKKRSALKSFIWRIVGVIVLAAVTFGYTGNWITTGLVTVIHHGVFLLVYYLHERVWLTVKLENMMWRSLAKMFTYETLCGNIILGTITYMITGSWKQMTAITLTYIGIKHVIYIWNEFIWRKIKWGNK
jgi:uncharacterized membrane protein